MTLKLFKWFLIIIFSLVIIVIAISFLLPKELVISKSIAVDTSKDKVFDLVNSFQNWEKWTPWQQQDSTLDIKYYGNPSGEGAGLEWRSDNSYVNYGNIVIIKSVPKDTIGFEIELKLKRKLNSYFILSPVNDKLKLEWTVNMDLGYNPILRWGALFIQKKAAEDMETGLLNISKLNEVNGLKIKIKEALLSSFDYISIKRQIKKNEIESARLSMINELADYIKKSSDSVKPFSFYLILNSDSIEMETAVRFNNTDVKKEHERVKAGVMNNGRFLVGDYNGGYFSISKAHDELRNWIKRKNKIITGLPFEWYITDSRTEKDSAKWLTKIYYPIE